MSDKLVNCFRRRIELAKYKLKMSLSVTRGVRKDFYTKSRFQFKGRQNYLHHVQNRALGHNQKERGRISYYS